MRKLLIKILFILSCLLYIHAIAQAQSITISGTVYDITKKTPVESVSVLATSGRGTTTDSLGNYIITLRESDSIYFSYLNKPTPKYAVKNISNPDAFNISIQKKIGELPIVYVRKRNYRFDSLQNRLDYQKIFDYKKPGIGITVNPGLAVGLDLAEFINMFKFKKNARMASFQKHLIREEQEAYVNHRYNKGLVKRLTGLSSPDIETFMREYKPTYRMTVEMNDLEFGQFIVEAYKYFKAGIKIDKTLFNKELE